MDSDNIYPFNLSHHEVDRKADACVDTLLEQIKADLVSINQHITGETYPLANAWDEICAQQRSEEFLIREPYEMTINGLIDGCFGELSQEDKLLVNFAVLQYATDVKDPEYDCLYSDEINAFLYKQVLEMAANDTNPRIEAYLDPCSVNEEIHNPDEYLLLRIDPARRADFLAALHLFGFVKNIDIHEQAVPLLVELLLDNLDVPNND